MPVRANNHLWYVESARASLPSGRLILEAPILFNAVVAVSDLTLDISQYTSAAH